MASKSKIVMKRALRGLYEGRHIQFGNKISEDGGNKSRRCWRPNVQKKRLYSLALDRYVQVRVTTHALRCMDKAGGFDEYLLKIRDRKLSERFVCWKQYIKETYKKHELEERIKAKMTRHFEEMYGVSEKEIIPASEEGDGSSEVNEASADVEGLNEDLSRLYFGHQEQRLDEFATAGAGFADGAHFVATGQAYAEGYQGMGNAGHSQFPNEMGRVSSEGYQTMGEGFSEGNPGLGYAGDLQFSNEVGQRVNPEGFQSAAEYQGFSQDGGHVVRSEGYSEGGEDVGFISEASSANSFDEGSSDSNQGTVDAFPGGAGNTSQGGQR